MAVLELPALYSAVGDSALMPFTIAFHIAAVTRVPGLIVEICASTTAPGTNGPSSSAPAMSAVARAILSVNLYRRLIRTSEKRHRCRLVDLRFPGCFHLPRV